MIIRENDKIRDNTNSQDKYDNDKGMIIFENMA